MLRRINGMKFRNLFTWLVVVTILGTTPLQAQHSQMAHMLPETLNFQVTAPSGVPEFPFQLVNNHIITRLPAASRPGMDQATSLAIFASKCFPFPPAPPTCAFMPGSMGRSNAWTFSLSKRARPVIGMPVSRMILNGSEPFTEIGMMMWLFAS